ncbi:hypothetical protein Rhopal_003895-T1 [Rhodotorula paludigena]|uniref:Uncharacterized protein n=1 Tax=Rhodotorula paludigena TaxID=86838 RepID=A0AAV5GMW5_9BASI|nr:hypothetical protein Rhopal_003895-T1 [Rhodotorula paludigena]
MPAAETVYVVTGANRGIGLALTSILARRPGTLVFATARQPAKADELNGLAKELGNIEVVQYEGPDAEQTKALADVVEKKAGKVDVVFANAGVAPPSLPVTTAPPENLLLGFNTNVLGPITLFQALWPLLQKSSKPQFVGVSSGLGSFGLNFPVESDAYSLSKVALNYAVKRMALWHGEKDGLIAWVLSPGVVITEMSREFVARNPFGWGPEMFLQPEQSAEAILKIADNATVEKTGGRFWDVTTGNEFPW